MRGPRLSRAKQAPDLPCYAGLGWASMSISRSREGRRRKGKTKKRAKSTQSRVRPHHVLGQWSRISSFGSLFPFSGMHQFIKSHCDPDIYFQAVSRPFQAGELFQGKKREKKRRIRDLRFSSYTLLLCDGNPPVMCVPISSPRDCPAYLAVGDVHRVSKERKKESKGGSVV